MWSFLSRDCSSFTEARIPSLLEGNTLNALELLGKENVLPEPVALGLKEDYLFLRRVEHCLQILEDRQIHAIPKDKKELKALARRLLGAERKRRPIQGKTERVSPAHP